MKRRKFTQATLIASTLPLAAGPGRLYGKPASLSVGGGATGEKFLLPLSRTGLPPSTWNEFASVSQIVDNVLGSTTESEIFFRDPKKYFAAHGLDSSDRTLVGESVTMLACLSNPAVQDSISRSDWDETLEYFRVAGLFEDRDPSLLSRRVYSAVEDNISEIRTLMHSGGVQLRQDEERLLLEVLETSGTALTEDDLAIVAQIISSGDVSPQSCTAVTVCAAAVTAAVAVTAVVYLMVAVVSAAAVITEVSTRGDSELPMGGKVPFSGSMSGLDPVLLRNSDRAIRMSAIAGAPGLKVHVIRSLVGEEVRAFMGAMQRAGLFSVDDEQLELSIRALTAYSHRVMGV